MRQRFQLQLELGQTPIEELNIPTKSRDELPPILEGLRWIFTTEKVSEAVFALLEEKISGGKKATGRPGMPLWHILVLGVLRLGLDCDYDRLEDLANHHLLIRQMLGVHLPFDTSPKVFNYKTLSQNVAALDEDLMFGINCIVAQHGRKVFKKNRHADPEPLRLKIDSYVLETNVHFPTDLNLTWDAQRKCVDIASFLCEKYRLSGWRKSKVWRQRMKNEMRRIGRISHGGGLNKHERLIRAVQQYINTGISFELKVFNSLNQLKKCEMTTKDQITLATLDYFHTMLIFQMDLLERRVINGETIPHGDKVFSLFENHTEWISKGKLHPSVELGHRVLIATDQHGLIVDYSVMDNTADVDALIPSLDRIINHFGSIQSVSTDKGFSRYEDRALLELFIPEVIIQKRGRLNKTDKEREYAESFVKLRHSHSAIESDINCLEHHGLNRCPDKGRHGYGRYTGFGVLAYNLHKIGACLIQEKTRSPARRKAA